MRSSSALLLLFIATAACSNDGPAGPLSPMESPIGAPPIVQASRRFDDAPLEGAITIVPQPSTQGWRYQVDLNEDGAPEHVGTLRGPIGFHYSLEEPGIHRLRVELEGPHGPFLEEITVAVNDPNALPVLASTGLPNRTSYGFTGMAVSGDGTLFAVDCCGAEELGGKLLEIDSSSLAVRRGLAIGNGALTIAVSPSDSLIFVTGDGDDFNLIHRSRWELVWHEYLGNGEQFVQALDDDRVLTSGEALLFAMVDPINRVITHSFRPDPTRPSGPQTWHFDASGDKALVAVSGWLTRDPVTSHHLFLLNSSDLHLLRDYPLQSIRSPSVAFHPSGTRVYLLGEDPRSSNVVLQVLDLETGQILSSQTLRPSYCGLCNRSRKAVSRDGRLIIMVVNQDTYFIDTELDIPRYRLTYGQGVAASTTEDAAFFLREDGLLTKVALPSE